MPLGAGAKDQEPVKGVGRGVSEQPEQDTQKIYDAIRQEREILKQGEIASKPADAETIQKVSRELPRLIQRILVKLEASQVYQTFKLPGSNYVVHDQREKLPQKQSHEKEKGESIRSESKMSLEALLVQKGKLQGAKEKGYENYLADPATRTKMPQAQPAAESKISKLLSRFEQILLKRFEGGSKVAQEAQEGRSSFFKKTADQWRSFFSHFVQRTVKRHVSVEHVDSWVYRGLVQKNAKATVISDLALTNGQVEKFARFRLSSEAQNLAQRLNLLEPGAQLSRQDLQGQSAEELEYLAIKNAEADSSWNQAPTQGKFLKTAQAEEKVAGDLGLQMSAGQKEKALRQKKQKRGGSFSGFGEESPPEEPAYQFVPWYSSFLPKQKGPTRWFVVVTYIFITVLVIFGLWSLVHGL
ncbi:MAG: hypothetical protein A3H42_00580 [Deltaproteobacteria bacterium RIFCSPLOWO2_02_FULL_46_8]|nr:MAG: hypothetical protein A3H42_00580 [Deltaproteobacteria bacterium RIFCSPLOWO2_02_FULL_46_8]